MIDFGDIFLYIYFVKEYRGNQIFFINFCQSCNGIIVLSIFFQQDIFCGIIFLNDVEVWEFFVKEVSDFRIDFNNFGINMIVFQDIQQIIGDFISFNNKKVFYGMRFKIIMEEYYINMVISDKDFIFILYGYVIVWNDNLMIFFYSVDNNIVKFFMKIRNGYLVKIVGRFNSEFYEVNVFIKETFDREGVGEVNDICDSVGS